MDEYQQIHEAEMGKLPEFDINRIKQRLRETIAWCQPRFSLDDISNSLRTPPIPEWYPGNHYSWELSRLVELLNLVAEKQSEAFRNDPNADRDFVGLAGGHLLISWLHPTHEGTSEAETDYFMDSEDLPAWDTWVDLFRCDTMPILLCWIPPEMDDMVTAAVRTNTTENIMWIEDAIEISSESFPFLHELKAAGLFHK